MKVTIRPVLPAKFALICAAESCTAHDACDGDGYLPPGWCVIITTKAAAAFCREHAMFHIEPEAH